MSRFRREIKGNSFLPYFCFGWEALDRSFERADRMQLICAPFEKRLCWSGYDTKSFRKKCQGRLRKHLADLCLQAGISGEAILHYETAIDILKPVNDWLWIGACFEGLCSASVILVYPRVKSQTLRRVESMSVKPGSSMGKETKNRAGSLKHNLTTNGLQELADPVAKTALNPADIIDKYRECILNYSKFKLAAVIELEACLKACRFLIQQRIKLKTGLVTFNYNGKINSLSSRSRKINIVKNTSKILQLGIRK
ncbi:TRAPPC9 [Mytilus edulis]|uniref:TRAPPC9 n=1 Tax=Mytilus edulis TaxID=6550 RepID=A0A8S3RWC5_MYTED|nr:TRAPPC9 [Mytilus edulis]